MPAEDIVTALVLDVDRVLLFHVIGSGRCWVEPIGGERLWANAGDVIVLPYGDAHRMGGVQDATCVSVSALIEPQPWSDIPMIRYGQGGDRTSVICGYLSCDDPLFDPRLRHQRARHRGHRQAGGLRLRGGVRPRVQVCQRPGPGNLARRSLA